MSQKLHLLLAEARLLLVDGEAVLSQVVKHLMKMFLMRSVVRARNQNVVKIDEDERQSSENVVHQTLESRPRIPQAKRHLNELEQAKRLDDCGLWNVVRKHLDNVVPLHEVEGGEHVGAGHIVREIRNVWNGVLVWNPHIVESAKISTGAPRTIGFRHHVKGGGPAYFWESKRYTGVEMGGPFVST